MDIKLPPHLAWQPISGNQWTAAHARHLCRRAGWSARSDQVEAVLRAGPATAVRRMFQTPPSMPIPDRITEAERRRPEDQQRARQATDPEERLRIQREIRQRDYGAFQELATDWLQFASDPKNAPYEKWVTFLQNVFVVSFDTVRNPTAIYQHHELLRRNGLGSYRDLCRAVSRSPAMMQYLNLTQSRASAPNENFARELFELFILGEGNYTETDVKEAARAFTGYRLRDGEFYLAPGQQDRSQKTIFGRTGRWNGDDVIRLALEQPAGSTFLPAEMCRFYLTDQPLPAPHIAELGKIWRQADFDLGLLLQRFFTSRLFYDEQFRGNLIKSPLQFHLGLVQDLHLTVPPFPRSVLVSYRQMGQQIYHPPNVRGWVGGQLWINSSTLSARRNLVETLFQPVNEDRLNADEQAALRAARQRGTVTLAVTRERLAQMAEAESDRVAQRFIDAFLPFPATADYRKTLVAYLENGPGNRVNRIQTAAMALLQSPEYNLC